MEKMPRFDRCRELKDLPERVVKRSVLQQMIMPLDTGRLARGTTLLLIGLCAGLCGGCGKKAASTGGAPGATDAAAANPAQAATAESEVMAALEKKDYDGVMAALAKARDAATTEADTIQFKTLCRRVSVKM